MQKLKFFENKIHYPYMYTLYAGNRWMSPVGLLPVRSRLHGSLSRQLAAILAGLQTEIRLGGLNARHAKDMHQ